MPLLEYTLLVVIIGLAAFAVAQAIGTVLAATLGKVMFEPI